MFHCALSCHMDKISQKQMNKLLYGQDYMRINYGKECILKF